MPESLKEENTICKETCMYEHFNLPSHLGFSNDLFVTFIDKTDGKFTGRRHLKTKTTLGCFKIFFRHNLLYLTFKHLRF